LARGPAFAVPFHFIAPPPREVGAIIELEGKPTDETVPAALALAVV
jgi:hypothetical protein